VTPPGSGADEARVVFYRQVTPPGSGADEARVVFYRQVTPPGSGADEARRVLSIGDPSGSATCEHVRFDSQIGFAAVPSSEFSL